MQPRVRSHSRQHTRQRTPPPMSALQESAIYCVGLYHGLLRLFGQSVTVNFSNSVRTSTRRGQHVANLVACHSSRHQGQRPSSAPCGVDSSWHLKPSNTYMTPLLLSALLCSCALFVSDSPPFTYTPACCCPSCTLFAIDSLPASSHRRSKPCWIAALRQLTSQQPAATLHTAITPGRER